MAAVRMHLAAEAGRGVAMLTLEDERALNAEAAREILREAIREPGKWAKGLLVGLLRGEAEAASFSFDEVLDALRRADPNPRRGMIIEVGADPSGVIYDL